jgi:peptidyl-prolyl cis-trans isomerase C
MRPMLVSVRKGLPLLVLASFVAAPSAFGQAAPKAKAAAADPVLVTVNGEPIRGSEILGILSRYSIPEGEQEEAYDKAVDLLINTHLLSQFLAKQKIKPDEAEVNRVIAASEKEFKENNTTLEKELAANGLTIADLQARIRQSTQWKQYLLSRATDAELKKYVDKNKDLLNGTLVHARHILIKVDEDAPEAEKEKAKQKILAVKKEIDSGKISFIDAANKYSEDPGNVETPSGGDLGYFPRRDKYIEPFSAAAFGMKKDEISDPILTEYGWHLIQVVDRKEGRPIDVKQMRDLILQTYGEDLQAQIVEELRPKAKIEIKPMPKNFVPTEPAPAPATTKPAAEPKKAATPK